MHCEWGWGVQWDSIKRLGPGYKDRPSGAGSGLVGPSRVWPAGAEWGWGGVGNALGFFQATRVGQVGPRGAEWGRVASRAG